MKKNFKILLLAIILLSQKIVLGTELPSDIIDYLETTEENSKIDGEEMHEILSELENRPIDINNSNEDDLRQIPFLTEIEIYQIIQHRKRYGKFQTFYELKHLPNFTIEKIKKVLPYLTITTENSEKSLNIILREHNHQISTLYQRNLPLKKGYKSINNKEPYYQGDPNKYIVKYRFNASNTFYLGYAGEKDAGEPIWNKKNKIFDFHTIYFQISQYKMIKSLCIGDYKANFGQGLIIGTSSLFGKSSNTVHPQNQKQGINRYTSLNENNYLRGLGITLTHKKWDYSLFLSHRKKDANLSYKGITSFKTDGMHRSINELEKKGNTSESIIGCNVKYRNDNVEIGGTFMYYQYSDTLAPSEQLYLTHRIKETDKHLNGGIHYKFTLGRFFIYGECAIDKAGNFATLNAATFSPTSRLSFMILHRNYQPEYQSMFGNGFGENSRIENEKGLYLGWRILPFKRITISAYADLYRFPWAKYGIDRSSYGKDFLIHLNHNTSENLKMELRYKWKGKSEKEECKQSLRYNLKGNIKRFSIQTQAETNYFEKENNSSLGWIIAQDIQFKSRQGKFSSYLRYAYFNASNYNNRIYLYEKDNTNGFSMPMHYGEGSRIAVNFGWKIKNKLQIHLNANTTIYTDGRDKCGSNYEESRGNKTGQIKCYLKWNFGGRKRERGANSTKTT